MNFKNITLKYTLHFKYDFIFDSLFWTKSLIFKSSKDTSKSMNAFRTQFAFVALCMKQAQLK